MLSSSITLVQGVYLAGLVPSLSMALLVLWLMRTSLREAVVPVGFFLALAAGFMASWMAPAARAESLHLFVRVVESAIPAMTYLLILQCMRGTRPRLIYWLILALPVVGGSSWIYVAMLDDHLCLQARQCVSSDIAVLLYQVFSALAVFLLLLVQIGQADPAARMVSPTQRPHRYWLMMALVLLSLCSLCADLFRIADRLSASEHGMIVAVFRISFMYLALTSLFRLFDTPQPADTKSNPYRDRPVSDELVTRIGVMMEQDKLYREMGFGREMMAQKLGVGEHVVSRTINQAFGVNVSEYINRYRIDEARRRLTHESVMVTVIAFEVGFSSIASFNRVFKAMAGCSPTEYRLNAQVNAQAEANNTSV